LSSPPDGIRFGAFFIPMTTFLEFLGNEKLKENPRKLIVLIAKKKHIIMQS
jgi:hypothetical protein